MTTRAERAGGGWRLALGVSLGVFVLRLLAATWRRREVNAQVVRDLRARRQPFVLVLWHGQMLPLLWHHRHEGIAIVISSHRDGEIIARIAQALGCRAIRGSTSRGGGRALLGIVRELERGGEVAVTPDGPRGPAESFAPGAAIAAHRAGVPIVALAAQASGAWRLRSWDRFMIPKPFARVTIRYSDPQLIDAASSREAESHAERLGEVLRRTSAGDGG